MASKLTATLSKVVIETDDTRRIRAIESEARRYPHSPVFQETVELLKKSIKPVEETQVSVTMPRDTAQKLYGLLGQITRHSGFDDLFSAFDKASFPLTRERPKLHFVRDNVIEASF